METQEINSLRKLQLAGAIILAYDAGEGNWIISECFCTKYGLDKNMSGESLKRLEAIYSTKVVRVTAAYEIEDRMADALKLAGYGCN